MGANWVSPVATSLFAAFGCGVCAVLSVTGKGWLAWWLFEFFVLLAGLASLRLVWIFRRLVTIVAEDDRLADEERNRPRKLSEIRQSKRNAG